MRVSNGKKTQIRKWDLIDGALRVAGQMSIAYNTEVNDDAIARAYDSLEATLDDLRKMVVTFRKEQFIPKAKPFQL